MSFDFKTATPANFAAGNLLFGAATQVAMSQSGQYMAALASGYSGGYYYALILSSNNGISWQAGGPIPTPVVSTAGSYYTVSISGSGQRMSLVVNNRLYVSQNYGASWPTIIPFATCSGSFLANPAMMIAMSYTGLYQTAVWGCFYTYINTTSDGGATWKGVHWADTWVGVSMSASGQYQAAVNSASQLYLSFDYGTTWGSKEGTSAAPSKLFSTPFSGTISAVLNPPVVVGTTTFWESFDAGSSWSVKYVSTSNNYISIQMSASGNFLIRGSGSGMLLSVDYGFTWTPITPFSYLIGFSVGISS